MDESLYLLWFSTLLVSESFHFYNLSFILNLSILTYSFPFNYAQSLLNFFKLSQLHCPLQHSCSHLLCPHNPPGHLSVKSQMAPMSLAVILRCQPHSPRPLASLTSMIVPSWFFFTSLTLPLLSPFGIQFPPSSHHTSEF